MSDLSPFFNEVNALVHLLEDPDEGVQQAVWTRLRELGRDAVPLLRGLRPTVEAPVRERLDAVIHELHFDQIAQVWQTVVQQGGDLERGAFLLALYRFPDLDIPTYQQRLDVMAERARPAIAEHAGIERVYLLSEYFRDTLAFAGNHEHYYNPNNSYLNWVIDERKGIPVSLSVIFLLLARRLNMPVFGVNMPAHFLVKYEDARNEVFLDLFNGGKPFLKEEGIRFLMHAGIRPLPHYFDGASDLAILRRMVRNLLGIAHESQQDQMQKDMQRLLEAGS